MNINSLQYHREKGIEYLKKGVFLKAIHCFKEYLSREKNDIDVLCWLGDAYSGLKNNSEARNSYLKGLALDPINMQLLLKYSEAKLLAPEYKAILEHHHKKIKPKRYIEIGVCRGASFKLVSENTVAIGIDPNPLLDIDVLPNMHIIVSDTSDNYFKSGRIEKDLNGKPFDMAFLDGMHVFEFVLRDFMNVERLSHSKSVIFVHDLYPINAETATPNRNSDFWSGDVWKLVLCLQDFRPDLDLQVLPSPPTGLGVISNLDASSTVIIDHYDEILKKYTDMSFEEIEYDKDKKLLLAGLDSPWLS